MAKIVSNTELVYAASVVPGRNRLVSRYTGAVTALAGKPPEGFPTWVASDRVWNGMELTWEVKSTLLQYLRITKKKRDYAYTVTDGKVVYEGSPSAGAFLDTDVPGPDVYYYTFWFREFTDDSWESRYWLRTWNISLEPNDVPDLLWRLLPAMYRLQEDERDNPSDINLMVNHILSWQHRETESLIQFLPKVLDVDNTPGPYLRAIAKYVGLEPNLELTYMQQREEIKAAIEVYKNKGTKASLERIAMSICSLPCEVVDYNQFILFTNERDKTTAEITLKNLLNVDLPDDAFYYTLNFGDGPHDLSYFGLYVTLDPHIEFSERVVRKLMRSVSSFAPLSERMRLQALTPVQRESYPVATEVVETVSIEAEAVHREAIVGPFLETMDSVSETNGEFTTTYAWPAETAWVVAG